MPKDALWAGVLSAAVIASICAIAQRLAIHGGTEAMPAQIWKGKTMARREGIDERKVWMARDRAYRGDTPKQIANDLGVGVRTVEIVTGDIRVKYHTVTDRVALAIIDDYEENGLDIKELAQKYHTRRTTVKWVLFDDDTRKRALKSRHKDFEEWFRKEWRETVGHE